MKSRSYNAADVSNDNTGAAGKGRARFISWEENQ